MRFSSQSRRHFLQRLALGAAAAPIVGRRLFADDGGRKIRHASFGTSGMAWSDVTSIASHPAVEVVAGCDVDERSTTEFRKKFPNARIYTDYRELLDKERDLQTVNVSTPDHMHAPIGGACLEQGLAVYGQKPLTHELYESRRLAELARDYGAVTQMGIQVHSSTEYRTAVKLIQDGAIGKVKEVHTWSSKKWGDSGAMPAPSPIPDGFHWDLWLGPRSERPFIGDGWYHPGNWRKRVDFGTGTFGDMGCHIYDPVFEALALTAPITVRSEGAPPNEHSWSTDAVVKYVFPRTPFSAGETVEVTWYDGDQRPPEAIQAQAAGPDGKAKLPDQGSIFVGTDGLMVLPHIAMPRLVGAKEYHIEPVAGGNHWHEFIDAVLGKGKTGAHFGYSGPLSEAVLLGSVASRFPQTTLNWDAKALKFTNQDEANRWVKRDYRSGWPEI